MSKLYAERDIENLGMYCNHVLAMTKEGLHSKSDIAAELAFRDEQNKLLREALSNLVLTSHENEERLADMLYRDFDESDALVEAKEALEATK